MTTKQPFISVDDAAQILAIGRATVIAAIRRREIPSVRIGRQYRIPSSYIQSLAVTPRPVA